MRTIKTAVACVAGWVVSTAFFWMLGYNFERSEMGGFWFLTSLVAGIALGVLVHVDEL